MFGYVVINRDELSKDEYIRFRSAYCGLCRALRKRYGGLGRIGLSYDMTFLALLLGALYEPMEETGRERCAMNPFQAHSYIGHEFFDYAADLNVALAYYKCLDNWQDDRSLAGKAGAGLLEKAFCRAQQRQPEKCRAIRQWLEQQADIEARNEMNIDLCANLTGKLLGELYACRSDEWTPTLRAMGEAMGRFIYFMDAYEDLPDDIKKGRFNPLKALCQRPDYEGICRDALTLLIADCTQQFETLPILQDQGILRNILYSGVWYRYAMLQAKKEKNKKETDRKAEKI